MTSWRHILRAGRDELSIQEAIYELLRHSNIRLSQIADRTGIPFSTLRTYSVDPDDAAGAYRSMPVHQIPPVTNATRNYILLDALEAACGRVGLEMPAIDSPGKDVLREIAGAIKEFAELVGETSKAIAQDGISPAELTRIETDGYETLRQILRLMAAARAACDEARG
jgi:hypothetical protein